MAIGCTGVHVVPLFSIFDACHLRSSRDSSVKSNFVFKPFMGMFMLSNVIRESARCMCPMFPFLDLPFKVFPEHCRMLQIEFYENCVPT